MMRLHVRRVEAQPVLRGIADRQPLRHIVVNDLLAGVIVAFEAGVQQRARIADPVQFRHPILHMQEVQVTVAEIRPQGVIVSLLVALAQHFDTPPGLSDLPPGWNDRIATWNRPW